MKLRNGHSFARTLSLCEQDQMSHVSAFLGQQAGDISWLGFPLFVPNGWTGVSTSLSLCIQETTAAIPRVQIPSHVVITGR